MAERSRTNGSALSRVPSVDRCLAFEPVQELLAKHPRRTVVRAIRETLADLREKLLAKSAAGDELLEEPRLADAIGRRTAELLRPRVRRVVNATGIILHTGLGRAVWPEAARRAMREEATGPAVVEISPETGERTVRTHAVQDLLCELTGAEAATVVNNNAAATMLILNTVSDGREVIVSRGQLVEIGGSFRMPDVMTKSGSILADVGTTNRTHRKDYVAAINENTGAIFRAHTSNYKVVGFTKEVPIEELVEIGREFDLPVIDDVGSGALIDMSRFGFGEEPVVSKSVAAGADLVCFSGDKLIGGPQSGFIVGSAECVRKMEKNPLARAFRVDKITLAGVEATLKMFLDEETLFEKHPTMRMVALPAEELERRANALRDEIRKAVPGITAQVLPESSQLGSGSLPTKNLPTHVVALRHGSLSSGDLARALRMSEPSIFPRVKQDEVLIDPRTLQDGEDQIVVETLAAIAKA